jgi:hypothetical protein
MDIVPRGWAEWLGQRYGQEHPGVRALRERGYSSAGEPVELEDGAAVSHAWMAPSQLGPDGGKSRGR